MDKRICVYPAKETDYASNGMGCIQPTKCEVHWQVNGEYELEIEHPIDEWGKYERICAYDRTIVAPVPEAPSMELRRTGSTTSVERYTIATRKSRLRLRSGPGTGYKCLGYYAKGKKVTLIRKTSSSWYEVTAPDGKHGWMSANYLQYSDKKTVGSVTTEILRELPMRPQPFDVYAFDPGLRSVTAKARHVFYRLAENMVCELEIKNKTAQQALAAAFAAALDQDHGFTWYCEGDEKHSMDKITNRSLADVILGDGGICETYGLKLLADWFDVFLVKDLGARRGVQLRYGKNITGISGGYDISSVATRVVPVGQKKNGDPLYRSGTKWLKSAHEDLYARPRYAVLDVSEAKVGNEVDGKKLTTSTARTQLDQRAQAMLDGGCDLPDCSITAQMALLRYDPAYAEYADLEHICPGDTLGLFLPDYGLALDVTASAYTFDALSQRYVDLTLGSPRANLSASGITSRQLSSGSVTGSKLAYGSVGSGALQQDVVSARHVQADSIGTDALQAKSVTAEKIAAGSVTADAIQAGSISTDKLAAGSVTAEKLQAGSVTTEKLDAGAVTAEKLQAGSVTTEKLDAGAVTANKLSAGSVTAEKLDAGAVTADKIRASAVTSEKIKAGAVKADHIDAGSVTAEKIQAGSITADRLKAYIITADSGLIANGAIGTAQIADSSITSAKVVSLSADVITAGTLSAERLVIVGEDGVIYRINASSAGLSASELSKDQYKNYLNGTVIVANSITAAQIAAKTITGNEIAANAIKAANIDVVELFASEATIAQINAMDISGNQYLKLAVKNAVDAVAVGGRNLALASGTEKSDAISATAAMGAYYALSDYGKSVLDAADVDCTISFEAKSSVVGAEIRASLRGESSSTIVSNVAASAVLSTAYKRYSYTVQTTAGGAARMWFLQPASTLTGTIYVRNIKVELGNVATDWSPAPEDMESELGALKNRVSEAELKITPNAIVSTVTSSESYQTLSSTASTAKSNAATAQSTADTAKANAATAQSTANTAKSKADANESDITALTTRVSQAEVKITPTAIAATVREEIEFGGRNFAADTNQGVTNWVWSMEHGDKTITEVVENGVRCCKLQRGSAEQSGWSIIRYEGLLRDALEPGTQYTLTVDIKASVSTTLGFLALATSSSTNNMVAGATAIANTLTANQWVRCEWRFTTLASFSSITIGEQSINFSMHNSQPGVSYTFRNLKLEKGSVATDWSPAPEDAAGAVHVDSSYSKVEINKDRVRIVSTQMEVAVPSEDGEDDVMRVDADGVHAEVVEADTVLSDSVVSTQGDASYTPADAGALAEILEELSGKYLLGVLSIDCKNVSSGSFEVQNVHGPGRIRLLNGTMNGLKIANCDCYVYCYSATFSTAETGAVVDNSERVYFSTCTFNAGVGIQLGSVWRARARMHACTGTCTVLAKLTLCSELDLSGSKPTGTLNLEKGSQVYNATSDPNFTAPSSGSVPTTQVATVSLSPTSTSTSGHSGLGSKLYQGRYSSSQSFRKGVMLFTLPSDLTSAANIESATLTIKRIAGVGGGGSVVAQIRCYDQIGTLYASKSVQNGQTVSIDVTSAVKAMKTSGYTGLMLYNPATSTVGDKTYTTGYARFAGKGESGAPVLKVTYKK